MNFKPTKWKVIVSLIIAALVNLVLAFQVKLQCDPGACSSEVIRSARIESLFLEKNLFMMIFILIGIYVIWSLLQKKGSDRITPIVGKAKK